MVICAIVIAGVFRGRAGDDGQTVHTNGAESGDISQNTWCMGPENRGGLETNSLHVSDTACCTVGHTEKIILAVSSPLQFGGSSQQAFYLQPDLVHCFLQTSSSS